MASSLGTALSLVYILQLHLQFICSNMTMTDIIKSCRNGQPSTGYALTAASVRVTIFKHIIYETKITKFRQHIRDNLQNLQYA